MKAVFPCKGVTVVTKQNVDVLTNFYKENLINSPMFATYNQGDFEVQVGKLVYLPQSAKIILSKDANLLTIQGLNTVLAKAMKNEVKDEVPEEDEPLSDDTIENHPFFTTLKEVN